MYTTADRQQVGLRTQVPTESGAYPDDPAYPPPPPPMPSGYAPPQHATFGVVDTQPRPRKDNDSSKSSNSTIFGGSFDDDAVRRGFIKRTIAFTYLVATLSSFFDTNSVIVAAGITAMLCLAITLFAIQTKIDFTLCTSLFFCILIVLIYFAFVSIILSFVVPDGRFIDGVYGTLAAMLISLVLVYDTQRIIGGKSEELNPEEYVYGALQLYIDVVVLFLIILAGCGKSG
ncbi:LFG2-like protein [Mya arenaria]|uniref:LFG2-like protein n=1 Tax=Mya arenaria TaxID=6604 RepID=A0ABY7ED00_MYAAR|nr:LFG2-like protein [Mya arenaria]